MKFESGKTLLDRYQILEQLGEGGFATVYHAYDSRLKRDIAIKVLKSNLDSEPDMERYRREARVLCSLTHKNILSVYSLEILDESTPCILMEYVSGKSLARLLLEKDQLDLELCRPIFIQICEGLAHAHAAGVVHRDLSPANILLLGSDPALSVKIIDFGLAKIVSAANEKLTRTGELLGNPSYMSPEQIQARSIDARSDLYALGCIMYEMLTGKRAFLADNAIGILYLQQNDMPAEPELPGVSKDAAECVKAIMLRCLQKNPDLRFQSAKELENTLRSGASITGSDDSKLQSWSSQRASSSAPKARTQKRKFVSLAVFALLIAFALTAFFVRQSINIEQAKDSPAVIPAGDRYAKQFQRLEKTIARNSARYGAESVQVATELDSTAEWCANQRHFADAVKLSERALSIRERHPNELKKLLDTVENLAFYYKLDKQSSDRSIRLYEKGAKLAEKGDLPNRMARFLFLKANMLFENCHNIGESEKLLRRALLIQNELHLSKMADQTESDFEIAASMRALSSVLLEQGKTAEAEKMITECLKIYDLKFGFENNEELAELSECAAILMRLGSLDKAEAICRRGMSITKSHGINGRILFEDTFISCLMLKQRYQQAITICKESLAGRSTEPRKILRSLQLGLCYRELGKFSEATQAYETAVNVAKSSGDKVQYIACLLDLAWAHLTSGEIAKAESICREVLPECANNPKIGALRLAQCAETLALCCESRGNDVEAAKFFEEAISADHNSQMRVSNCLLRLTVLYAKKNDEERAVSAFKKALLTGNFPSDRQPVKDCIARITEFYKKAGRPQEAKHYESILTAILKSPKKKTV